MSEESMKWIFNNGLAVSIILAIFYGFWKGARAFFSIVLVPLKDAAISHLQSTTQHLDATNKTLEKTGETMDRVCSELRECRTDIAHIKTQTERCRHANQERTA